jgi:UDP-N-acetylglucosamine--N-acetylmuramyl-(pentapeptide) pyrophosphoryl-undecaprenol N-acetylglucosamine transferase
VAALRRVVFAGGGTGGHLFPALAVADAIAKLRPGLRIEFVGARRGLESRLVPRAGYPLHTLPLSGLKGASVPARILAAAGAGLGVLRCVAAFLGRRPSLVIGVGGYASGPAVVAAWLLRVPRMLMEQNHFPGATNRFLAPRADLVCVPSEAARARLNGHGVVTGNPVRAAFSAIGPAPSGERVSLLVFGGSRGARSINRAVVEALPRLAEAVPGLTIVHQTGEAERDAVAAAYGQFPSLPSTVLAFIDDMPRRLAEAELVVCRAGATTLAELAAAGRPAILVPYPHAADDHQRLNAEAVRDAGGAVVLPDGAPVAGEIVALGADRPLRLRMATAMKTLARPDAASRIAALGLALAEGREAAGVP